MKQHKQSQVDLSIFNNINKYFLLILILIVITPQISALTSPYGDDLWKQCYRDDDETQCPNAFGQITKLECDYAPFETQGLCKGSHYYPCSDGALNQSDPQNLASRDDNKCHRGFYCSGQEDKIGGKWYYTCRGLQQEAFKYQCQNNDVYKYNNRGQAVSLQEDCSENDFGEVNTCSYPDVDSNPYTYHERDSFISSCVEPTSTTAQCTTENDEIQTYCSVSECSFGLVDVCDASNLCVAATCKDSDILLTSNYGGNCPTSCDCNYQETNCDAKADYCDANYTRYEYQSGNSCQVNQCVATPTPNSPLCDLNPPTAPTLNPISKDWTNQNIQITISGSTDAETGVSHYQYCTTTNGNTCTPNINGSSVTLSTTGQHTVCARAVDNAGRVSSRTCSSSDAYKIDKIDPSSPTFNPTNRGWNNTNVTIIISGTDTGGSGVEKIEYCTTTGTDCTPNTQGTSLTISSNGEYRICAIVTDNAGNSGTKDCSGPYNVDKELPSITSITPENDTVTYEHGKLHPFGASVTDSYSDVKEVFFVIEGQEHDITSTGPGYYYSTTLAAGNYNYYFTATDYAGNTFTTQNYTYIVEKAIPSLTSSLTTPITYSAASDFTASENNQGDNGCTYVLTRNGSSINNGSSVLDNSILAAGTYLYNYSTLGCANYTSHYITETLIVNKAPRNCTLSTDKGWSRTYDESASTTTCDVNAGTNDGLMIFTKNTNSINSPDNQTNTGTYNYTCTWVGGINYSDCAVQTNTLTINKANGSVSLTLNGNASDITITYPNTINASASTPYGNVTLERNSVDVSTTENNIAVILGAKTYNYTAYSTGDNNHLPSQISRTLTINKRSGEVQTFINNSRNNLNLEIGRTTELVGNLSIGTGNIYLYLDGNLIGSGNSPLSNTSRFTQVGLFNVTTVYNGNQNYTSDSETFFVNVTPYRVNNETVNITFLTPLNGTEPHTVNASVSVTVSGNFSYSWMLKYPQGAAGGSGQNFNTILSQNGSYELTFFIKDDYNNSYNESFNIFVNDTYPTANFYFSPNTVSEGEVIDFTDNSSAYDSPIQNWNWTITGPNTNQNFATQNISYNFTYNGTYNVQLHVWDNDGSKDTTIQTVNISNKELNDSNVNATFNTSTGSLTGQEPFTVEFNVDFNNSNSIKSINWTTSGSNTVNNSNNNSVVFNYTQQGTYLVELNIEDTDGDTYYKNWTVNVTDTNPQMSFIINPNTNLFEGLNSSIITSTATAYDGINFINWTILLPNSSTYFEGNNNVFNYTWPINGTYFVTLNAVDNDGSPGSLTQNVTAGNVGLNDNNTNVTFNTNTGNLTGVEPFAVGFNVNFTNANNIASILWTTSGSNTYNTSNQTSGTFNYTQQGNYTINLTIVDTDGDVFYDAWNVTVLDTNPDVNFTWLPQVINESDIVNFTDLSNAYDDPVNRWNWTVTMPNSNVIYNESQNFSYQLMQNGTYTITLTAWDADNSSGTTTKNLIVNNIPLDDNNTNVTFNTNTGNLNGTEAFLVNYNINFTNANQIASINWSTTGSNTGNYFNTSSGAFNYSQNGTYIIYLSVIDIDGDTYNNNWTVNVADTKPAVNFSIQPPVISEGERINLTDLSKAYDSPLRWWNWTIILPNSSTQLFNQQNITDYTLQINGTHTITLNVTDNDGSWNIITKTYDVSNVEINETDINTTVNDTEFEFDENITGVEPFSTTFNVSVTGGNNISIYEWKITGPYNTNINFTNPSFNYNFTQNGTYNLSLTLVDVDGDEYKDWTYVIVDDTEPTPDFTVNPQTTVEGMSSMITSNSTAYDNITRTEFFVWKQGNLLNNTINNSEFLSYNYVWPENGTFTVGIRVDDHDGSIKYLNKTFNITNDPIENNETNVTINNTVFNSTNGTFNGVEPLTINFTVDSNNANQITSYTWIVSGPYNTSEIINNKSGSYYFDQNGTYSLFVRIIDVDGDQWTGNYTIIVDDTQPTANFIAPTSAIEGVNVNITDNSIIRHDNITYRNYTITRNEISSIIYSTANENFSFLFPQNGSYDINLTLIDADGSTSYAGATIIINDTNPNITNVNITPQNITEGITTVNFAANATGHDQPIEYNWSVYDWNYNVVLYNDSQSFNNIFVYNGTYNVSLIITDTDGSTSQTFRTIAVDNYPVAVIANTTPVESSEPTTVTFDAIPVLGNPTYNYTWYWNNGSIITTNKTFNHTFTNNGTYTLFVNITDIDGDKNSSNVTVTVNDTNPTVDFILPNRTTEGVLTNITWNVTENNDAIIAQNYTIIDSLGNNVGWNNSQNFSFIYPYNDTYNVTLTVWDSDSSESIRKQIIVDDTVPQVSFTINPNSSLFEGQNTSLIVNTSSAYDGISFINWSILLPDNTVYDVDRNHSFNYTWPINGTYFITLNVTDNDGSERSHTENVTVGNVGLNDNNTNVTFNTNTGNLTGVEPFAVGFNVNFTNANNIASILWTTSGSNTYNTSNQTSGTFNYTQQGNYTINLTIVDTDGDKYTNTWSVTVLDSHPNATFNIDNQWIADESTFTRLSDYATSYQANNSILTLLEGQTSVINSTSTSYDSMSFERFRIALPNGSFYVFDQPDLAYTWPENGTYEVRVITRDADDPSQTTMRIRNIEIGNVPINDSNVTTNYTTSTGTLNGTEPFLVNFNVSVDNSNGPYVYNWTTTGSNTVNNSNATSVSFNYTQNGTYKVYLTVTDSDGDQYFENWTVGVDDTYPVVNFTYNPQLINESDSVNFTDLSTAYDSPINGWNWTIYDWNNNAVTYNNSENFTFTFLNNGTYNAYLTVWDYDGSTNTTNKTIVVGNVPLDDNNTNVTFNTSTGNLTGLEPFLVNPTVTFNNANNIASILWTTNGSNTYNTSNSTSPVFNYTQQGNYNINLIIVDIDGDVYNNTWTVTVLDSIPNVNFTWNPNNPNELQIVNFTGNASAYDGVNTSSWTWSIAGIGIISNNNSENLSYDFNGDGNYAVTLNVWDLDGSNKSITRNIFINDSGPIANFDWNPKPVYEGEEVQFNDTSISDDGINAWFWDFGDGNFNFTSPNPKNTYLQNGSYQVNLTVTESDSDKSWIVKNITVLNNPINDSEVNVTFNGTGADDFTAQEWYLASFEASVNDTSIYTYQWTVSGAYLGYPIVNNSQNFTHNFTQNGTYIIDLLITDADGDTWNGSWTANITDTEPILNYTYSSANINEGEVVIFNDSSTAYDQPLTTLWNITGPINNYTYSKDFVYNFSQNGTYTVNIKVTDNDGSFKTDSFQINVSNIGFDDNNTNITITNLNGTQITETEWFNMVVNVTTNNTNNPTINWTLSGPYPAYPINNNTWNFNNNFTQNGTYLLVINITDSDGDKLNKAYNIEILDTDPAVYFNWTPVSPNQSETTTFNATVNAYDGVNTSSWNWKIDGNFVNNSQDFTYQFPDDGNYTVSLTVFDNDGSSNTTTHTVTVQDTIPQVNFTWSPLIPDEGEEVQFNETVISSDNIIQYTWIFGDGSTPTTTQNPKHTYLNNGTYTITLTANDKDGSIASHSKNITIGNIPINDSDVNITLNANTTRSIVGEEPFTVNFNVTVTSGNNISSYEWKLNNGSVISTNKDAIHTFLEDGLYYVNLTLIDNDGDSLTTRVNITVTDSEPTADFYWLPTELNESDFINITDNSSAYDDLSAWEWNITSPNGSSYNFSSQNITDFKVIYNGTYFVTLNVSDDDGSWDVSTKNFSVNNIGLNDNNTNVTSNLNTTYFEGEEPLTAYFNVTVDNGNGPYDYTWIFDGPYSALPTIVTNKNDTSHTFEQNGTYTVNLTIEDNDGDQYFKNWIVNVTDSKPRSDFILPIWSVEGNNVNITDNSTKAQDNITYRNYTIETSIGTIIYSTSQENFTYLFANNGIYQVNLTLGDHDGSFVTTSKTIFINDTTPTANFSINPDNNLFEGNISTLTNSSYAYDGIVALNWTITGPNSTYFTTSNHTFNYIWLYNGGYEVNLTVTDGDGDKHTKSEQISINNVELNDSNVNITVNTSNGSSLSGLEPFEVNISAIVTTGNYPITYSWKLDNGTTLSTSNNVSHIFEQDGNYQIILNITDFDGDKYDRVFNITVHDSKPDANFSIVPSTGLFEGDNSTLTNTSTAYDGVLSLAWTITLPNSSIITNNSHSFNYTWPVNGTYIVNLTAIDSDGSTNIESRIINISNVEINDSDVNMTVNGLDNDTITGVEPFYVELNVSVDNGNAPYTYNWMLNNGTVIGTTEDASQNFTQDGNYTIFLTITDSDGDVYNDYVNVTVLDTFPAVSFNYNPTNPNESQVVTFNDTSGAYDMPISWNWTITGPNTNVQNSNEDFTYNFTHNGTYLVNLLVTDNDGSVNSSNATIIVNDIPINESDVNTTFVTSNTTSLTGYEPFTVNFSTEVTGGNAPYTYNWTLGNGTVISSTNNGIYTFDQNGSYTINLTIVDSDGDIYEEYWNITVLDTEPIADFIIPSSSVEGEVVNITDNSTENHDMPVSRLYEIFNSTGDLINTSTAYNYSYLFIYDDVFTINLTLTDVDGSINTTSKILTVNDTTPTSSFTVVPDSNLFEGNTSTLTNTSIAYDGIASLAWVITLPNSTTYLSNNHTFNYMWPVNGTYNVNLTITDGDGDIDWSNQTIIVNNRGLNDSNVNATFNTSTGLLTGPEPFTAEFNVDVSNGNGPFNYLWTLGNGSVLSTGKNGSYTFTNDGVYQLILNLTDADGDKYDKNWTITVLDTVAAVNFTQSPNMVNEGDMVFFNDTSSAYDSPLSAWNWIITGPLGTFTNGSQNISYEFTQNGTYIINLTVWDSDNTPNSTQRIVNVNNVPINDSDVNITLNNLTGRNITGVEPFELNFSVDVPNNISEYNWTLSNGTVLSNESNGNYTFYNDGFYQIELFMVDIDGDEYETTINVTVLDTVPATTFTIDPNSSLFEANSSFINSTSNAYDGISSTDWIITGPNSSYFTTSNNSFNYKWQFNGTYTVILNATDSDGSWNVTSQTVDIGNIEINGSDVNVTLNGSNGFNAISGVEPFFVNYSVNIINGNAPYTYNWTITGPYGTYYTTNLASDSYNFTQNGTYIITLNVTDADGDKYNNWTYIYVNDTSAIANFSTTPDNNSVERLDSRLFTNTSHAYDGVSSVAWNINGPVNYSLSNNSFNVTFNTTGIYNVNMSIIDGDGSISWYNEIINVTDNTEPNITEEINVSNYVVVVDNEYAKISWLTDEVANSSVGYGLTTGLGNNKNDSSFVINHSIELRNLTPGTTYYFNITSCDPYNNCKTIGPFNFTTTNYSLVAFNSTIESVYFVRNHTLDVLEEANVAVTNNSLINNSLMSWSNTTTAVNESSIDYYEFTDAKKIVNCIAIGDVLSRNLFENSECNSQTLVRTDVITSNISGTSLITDSYLRGTDAISMTLLNSSNLTFVSAENATVQNSNISDSTFKDSEAYDSEISTSTVNNGSIINESSVSDSNMINSVAENGSRITANSYMINSTFNNAFTVDSNVTEAIVNSSDISGSDIYYIDWVADSNVTDSTLTEDVRVENSEIDDSVINNTYVYSADISSGSYIDNSIIRPGSVVINCTIRGYDFTGYCNGDTYI
jgi:PKD repeat protein